MNTFTVQIDQVLSGTWKEHARFNYKEAAARGAKIIRQNPDQRVTVWDQSFEVVVNTRLGIECDADCHKSEYHYIAQTLRNAREEA